MAATPAQKQAARHAAVDVENLIIEMLEAGEIGSVAVIVLSPYELKPVKRVETEGKTVKVKQGYSALSTL